MGQLAEAAAKFSEGWTESRDPEVLFDLAVCYERQGRSAEAAAGFRAYLNLPLALRLRVAEDHLGAIESKNGRDVPEPRRVRCPSAVTGTSVSKTARGRHYTVPTLVTDGDAVRGHAVCLSAGVSGSEGRIGPLGHGVGSPGREIPR